MNARLFAFLVLTFAGVYASAADVKYIDGPSCVTLIAPNPQYPTVDTVHCDIGLLYFPWSGVTDADHHYHYVVPMLFVSKATTIVECVLSIRQPTFDGKFAWITITPLGYNNGTIYLSRLPYDKRTAHDVVLEYYWPRDAYFGYADFGCKFTTPNSALGNPSRILGVYKLRL